ncbi:MAG: hypothetical protein HY782_03055, partial [Chloroflexi bacterium]|nr:hypothetical protein [Chloroflexota bacterium]
MNKKHWMIAFGVMLLILLPIPALAFAKVNTAREFSLSATAFAYTPNFIRV